MGGSRPAEPARHRVGTRGLGGASRARLGPMSAARIDRLRPASRAARALTAPRPPRRSLRALLACTLLGVAAGLGPFLAATASGDEIQVLRRRGDDGVDRYVIRRVPAGRVAPVAAPRAAAAQSAASRSAAAETEGAARAPDRVSADAATDGGRAPTRAISLDSDVSVESSAGSSTQLGSEAAPGAGALSQDAPTAPAVSAAAASGSVSPPPVRGATAAADDDDPPLGEVDYQPAPPFGLGGPSARAVLDPATAARAAELRAQIERDRDYLRTALRAGADAPFDLGGDAELAAIADRLPRLQAELDALLGATPD